MRPLLASAGLALFLALATEPSVSAQEAPDYFKQTLPEQALKPHWDEQLTLMNPKGALDGKTKQLIALGVAAQIPCVYCVYGHTKLAKAAGATDAEIKEAIATAALVRFNSTMLQGSGYDLQKFQQEVDRRASITLTTSGFMTVWYMAWRARCENTCRAGWTTTNGPLPGEP